jgi:hypothetical protein
MKVRAKAAAAAIASAAVAAPIALGAQGATAGQPAAKIKHVLLISVDGMHQSDLAWYVAKHPHSELAKLTKAGREYTSAQTSNPSDSDPGGSAIMTGADPGVMGVYYDVEYSHAVDEAGAKCTPGRTTRWRACRTCLTTTAARRSRRSTRTARSTRTGSTRTRRRS